MEPASFRFPALAALSGRLALGSGREAVVATLLAARLAENAASAAPLPIATRLARAAAARQWLPALCPDARVRAACTALVDASATDRREPIAKALARVIDVTGSHLDRASRAELQGLLNVLSG